MTGGAGPRLRRGGNGGGAGCGAGVADHETTRFVAQFGPDESIKVVMVLSHDHEMELTDDTLVGSLRKGKQLAEPGETRSYLREEGGGGLREPAACVLSPGRARMKDDARTCRHPTPLGCRECWSRRSDRSYIDIRKRWCTVRVGGRQGMGWHTLGASVSVRQRLSDNRSPHTVLPRII